MLFAASLPAPGRTRYDATVKTGRSLHNAILTACLAFTAAACATSGPLVAQDGSPLYTMTIPYFDGLRTTTAGPTEQPICTVRVGGQAVKVWLAPERASQAPTAPSVQAGSNDLVTGVQIDTAWQTTVVYNLSLVELKLGRASVEVPATPKPVMLELRFRPAGDPPKP